MHPPPPPVSMAGKAAVAAAVGGRFILAVVLVLAACTVPLAAAQAAKSEADVLNEFRAALRGPDGDPPRELNQWTTGSAPCVVNTTQWPRVKHCVNGRVLVLQLEGLQLQGAAPDLALLAPLQGLRSLSLGNNNLTGAFPDVSALPALRSLFLYQNRLAGEIPDGAFKALRGLQKLNLSGNAFSGPIPSSIASSRHLLWVDLSNNNFSGSVPQGLQKLGANNVHLQETLIYRHIVSLFDTNKKTFALQRQARATALGCQPVPSPLEVEASRRRRQQQQQQPPAKLGLVLEIG